MLFGQYEYNTNYVVTNGDAAGAAGLFAGAMLIWMVIYLAIVIVMAVAMWKIFVKAGKEGWEALVPIHNMVVLIEIAGKPGWWIFSWALLLIPIINFVAWIVPLVIMIIVALELGKAFGKDTVWSVFLLVLLPIIGYSILGFGGDKFDKTKLSPRTSTGFPESDNK